MRLLPHSPTAQASIIAFSLILSFRQNWVEAFSPSTQRRNFSPVSLHATDPESIVNAVRDVATGGTLAVAGDVLAQSLTARGKQGEESGVGSFGVAIPPKDLDAVRTASLGAFGALYTGGAQHYIFGFINESLTDPVQRLLLAQFCFIPFLYYPTYLLLVPALRALPLEGQLATEERDRLRKQVIDRLPVTLVRNWAYWVPVQFLQFSFVPPDLHVTYCAAFGVIWNAILSWSTMQEGPPTVPVELKSMSTSSIDDTQLSVGSSSEKEPAAVGSEK